MIRIIISSGSKGEVWNSTNVEKNCRKVIARAWHTFKIIHSFIHSFLTQNLGYFVFQHAKNYTCGKWSQEKARASQDWLCPISASYLDHTDETDNRPVKQCTASNGQESVSLELDLSQSGGVTEV